MDTITFEKLSPTTDADVKVYKEAFDFVFSNNDVRNVAISGAYGAGKSSILESYKKSCQSHWLKRVLNFFVNKKFSSVVVDLSSRIILSPSI